MTQMSEAAKTAAVRYRTAEKEAYLALQVDARLHLLLTKNPALMATSKSAWGDAEARIMAHFRAQIPTSKRARDRGEGPKVYEVHHARTVALEALKLAMVRQIDAGETPDPVAAATFALRRIGVTEDPETFFLASEIAA